jgi:uncharacterized membrane protein
MQEKIIKKKRYSQIDILRGLFFIPMFIFHLFSMYDLTNNFNTSLTSNKLLSFIGNVRDLYILLAGYSVYLSYQSYKESNKDANKESNMIDFIKYRLSRSGTIAIHALLITAVSHYLYPNFGIKFGILHFIAVGTLILAPITALDSPAITFIIGAIWLYITSNNLIPLALGWKPFGLDLPFSNEVINTITGKFIHYNMADYFPLNKKLILLICGLFLAQVIHPKLKPTKNDKTSVLEEMGKYSLELYTSHFIIIMITYYILKNKI